MTDTAALTTTDLEPTGGALATLEDVASRRAAEIVDEHTPDATKRARQGALDYFAAWARVAHGQAPWPVPPALVLDFVTTHLDGLAEDVDAELQRQGVKKAGRHSVSTIEARIRHLSKAHKAAGLESPAKDERVRSLLSAARRGRAKGEGVKKASAVTLGPLERLLDTCQGGRLMDLRDRALLLVGWASGGRRRSELAGLQVEDLAPTGGEYVWTIRTSKTDQEGHGLAVPIAGRAAAALAEWLEAAGIESGPVFRGINRHGGIAGKALSGRAVYDMMKKRGQLAGLDTERLTAHSLRSGYMTESGRQGVALAEAMALSGHRTAAVALGYHRAGDVLRSRAGRLAG